MPDSVVVANPATLSAKTAEDAVFRKVVQRIVPFLFLCYIVNFFDRTNIGYAQLSMREQLGFSNAIYGLGASLFYVGYIAFEVPSNLLLQRIGAPRTIMRIMVLWGMMSTLMAFIATPLQFYLLRFLLGVGEAGFMPGILFYLSCWVPAARRARVTALFMLAIPLSGVIGGPISGAIMKGLDGALGVSGWQWLFLLEGSPAILLGVIAYFRLSRGPESAPWLSSDEKQLIGQALARDVPRTGKPGGGVAGVLRDPMLYLLAFYCIGMNGSIGGFSFWLPTIVKELGVADPLHIGLLVSLPYLAGAVTLFLVGRHSDRTQERRLHAALCMLVASSGWLLLPIVQGQALMSMLCISVATAATLGCLACFWSMIPLHFPHAVAVAFAAVSSLGSLGSLASPVMVGWISSMTGSVASGTLYLGGVMILAASTLLWGTRGKIQA
ncbi:MFS transporter [Herbaspirillum sp. NPDC087042]|uniref:MFS transporter n=1 Tax=Herbaspirillum sp. NPDC087042 TaxID=3364004 RepID=UPI0037FC1107